MLIKNIIKQYLLFHQSYFLIKIYFTIFFCQDLLINIFYYQELLAFPPEEDEADKKKKGKKDAKKGQEEEKPENPFLKELGV